MKISILTLFPDMFAGPFAHSIVKRAVDQHKVTIQLVNIRDYATDSYKTVDGRPYGGGVGMILRVDVVDRALKSLTKGHSVLLDAGGVPYKQSKAGKFSALDHLILICGHYEGVDARIRDLADEEISVGDYILTGGEIPAMTVVDSVVRLIPGVLTKPAATTHESFTTPTLEYPQYTEPREYHGVRVPDILLSGNHKAIDDWRKQKAQEKTSKLRPDLLT